MMQGQAPEAHTVVEIVSGIISLAGFVILLMIKNNQATVKEELVEKQTELKDELIESQNQMRHDMDQKHAENKQGLAVHIAADDQQFKNITSTLNRMDYKLDKIQLTKT